MKKIILRALTLAVAITFAIAGCNGSGVGSGDESVDVNAFLGRYENLGGSGGGGGSSFTDSRDRQSYRTVIIGKRWMAENLNYATSDSWCYDNDNSNCARYGRLYTWDAARSACPSGWRLPDTTDWRDLVRAAGGSSVAGTKLKSKNGWSTGSGYIAGTDDFGFSALPGGIRSTDGSFYSAGNYGYWWSATEYGSGNAVNRDMYYNGESVGEYYNGKSHGFSVRCRAQD